MIKDKNIIQTSPKFSNPQAVRDLLKNFPGWKYRHFDDAQCIKYMESNPIDEIINPTETFFKFKRGEHRADFFRYYYLYLNGGLFIDSDLMIYKNIEDYLESYEFVSCSSAPQWPESILQAFLYAQKGSEIIFDALKSMYFYSDEKINFMTYDEIDGYLTVTRDLWDILYKKHYNKNFLILQSSHLIPYVSPVDGNKYLAHKIGLHKDMFGIHWQAEEVIHKQDILKSS
jgi:hypothetical protein